MVILSPLLLSAAVLELLYLSLRSVPTGSAGVVQAIPLQFLTHIVYLVCVYQVLLRPAFDRRWVLAWALLFRLTLWTAYPLLSDDVYRYRWEGKLQSAGGNPYQTRPADATWAGTRDATFPNVGSKDFKAGYGPLIELEERLVYEVSSRLTNDPFVQVFWYKFPAALFESLTVPMLAWLLKRHRFPESHLLIYAWCPTPIVEFWWNGHNDALPLLLIAAALVLATYRRWVAAFAALSAAVAAKLWPVLLFPAFVLHGERERPRWWQWTIGIPLFALAAAPFWSNLEENAQFMTGFVGGWRNNDSLFGILLWIAQGDLYGAKYMAATLIGLTAVGAALLPWRLEAACLATLAGTLLLSANAHPWYMSWFAPFLPFAPWLPVLLWMALQPLGYSVLLGWKATGEWDGNPSLRWLAYGPIFIYPFVQWYLGWRRSRRRGLLG